VTSDTMSGMAPPSSRQPRGTGGLPRHNSGSSTGGGTPVGSPAKYGAPPVDRHGRGPSGAHSPGPGARYGNGMGEGRMSRENSRDMSAYTAGGLGATSRRSAHGSAPPSPSNSAHSGGGASTRSNGGAGSGSAVKVVVRVRPLNNGEMNRGERNTVEVADDQRSLTVVDGMRQFNFDACLSPDTTQPEVMIKCGVPRLLDSALHGYAATIFAYGQTGSGKTFSMSGREELIERQDWAGGGGDDGIMTRSLAHIFAAVNRAGAGVKFRVKCTYLEIYNEAIYDLLSGDNERQLTERWEPQRGFYVPELVTVDCACLDDALAVIGRGTRNRRVGSHELNKDSSRSHSMMTVHVESHASRDGVTMSKFGKVSFVDLAGSERLKSSKSEGQMVTETANINRSLFMLGKVIAMLSDGEKNTHIPYRDSKLTKLLMDSLGGSSLALMIACCSPSSNHMEETLSTLHYATRARNIINRPSVMQDPTQALISNLRHEVELLKKENAVLRGQLGLPVDAPVRANSLGSERSSPERMGPPPPLYDKKNGTNPRGRRSPAGSDGFPVSSFDGEPMGSVPIDPEFLGMSKTDLATRVKRAEAMMQRYVSENQRLAGENDNLRGSKTLIEIEHKAAIESNDELLQRIESLEMSFLNGADDDGADAFGFENENSKSARSLHRNFPEFGTAKRSLNMYGTAPRGGSTNGSTVRASASAKFDPAKAGGWKK
jgi:hypothetical protein